jgi:small subunit ribosomal protein S15
MMTERINRVSAHLSANKKDKHCKRSLSGLTVRRRKILEYMTRRDYQGYRVAVKELGLRPVPLVYSRHLPKVRLQTHKQINERNRHLKNRVSRGHKGH